MSDERSRVLAAEYLELAEMAGGCCDGYCVVVRPKGMHTNGGCKCTHDMDRTRERAVARLLLKAQTLSRAVLERDK